MSEDPLALYSITSTMPSSDPSVLPSESDYEAICAAVMETLRGRWFLAEYARRNRHSDTKVVLSAIERIEAMIRGDSVATPSERLRNELADMAKAIARTKSEIAAIKPEAEQPGKILEASEELDSIVHATEKATSNILAAAEQVQEIAWTVREQDFAAPICDQLDALATDIYTACSFQDLTGQRIQKVIHAMRYLEERIDTMINIWDDGASAEARSTPATEAKPAATAPQAAHHDVAQDDLNQTDVDMVMDPAQQDAAVKAEAGVAGVTIDHEPLLTAEPLKPAEPQQATELLQATEVPQPAARDPMPETVSEPESAPEGVVPEPLAPEMLAPETPAPQSPAQEAEAASEAPDEVPIFFRTMEPSGPVAEAAPAEDRFTPAADATPIEATSPEAAEPHAIAAEPESAPETAAETATAPETDLAPTIAAVREALFGAFPGLAERKADDTDEATLTPASIGDDEPAAELYEPAPAVAEHTRSAEPETAQLAEPDDRLADIAQVSEPQASEPQVSEAQVSEPVADDVDGRATPTLVGPADFLLEPLSPPALELAAEADEPVAAIEPIAAVPEIETLDIETLDIETLGLETAKAEVAAVEPAKAFEHDLAAIETARVELTEATEPEALGEIEAAPEITDPAEPIAFVAETEAAEVEREAAVIEAVSPGPEESAEPIAETYGTETAAVDADEIAEIEAAELSADESDVAPVDLISAPAASDELAEPVTALAAEPYQAEAAETEPAPIETTAIETAEIEIVEIEIAEIETAEDEAPAHLTAEPEATEPATTELEASEFEAAEPDVTAPALAATEVEPEAIEFEIVDIAEIEAVATAPVAPEAVADTAEPEIQSETKVQAEAEEAESIQAEEAKEEAEEEQRPAARTAMPEVTFASMTPVMMPMEATRAEPAYERFAAAATATPTQGDFIPFGYAASALPTASARPIAVAAPSIYPSPPDLVSSRAGAAHVTQADPLAAIMGLTDDEKIALFS
jgi:chemotaxis regulatin CheY-phosphate phosphatase CheZ